MCHALAQEDIVPTFNAPYKVHTGLGCLFFNLGTSHL